MANKSKKKRFKSAQEVFEKYVPGIGSKNLEGKNNGNGQAEKPYNSDFTTILLKQFEKSISQ